MEELSKKYNQLKENKEDKKVRKIKNKTLKHKPIMKFVVEESSSEEKPTLIEKNRTFKNMELKEKIDFEKVFEKKSKSKSKKNKSLKMSLKTPIVFEVMEEEKRYNEEFIDLMEKLSDIMLKQGEPFRARAYQKAQETIMAYPKDINKPSDLKGLPCIGSTIMEKLEEYVKTGTLRVLEREKTNPVNILAEVYGIGPKKAKELVDQGITSIAQLRENQNLLNDVQKVGLKYYEDILERIPRSEIEEYKTIFENAFPKGTDGKMEIVGSYRRGAQSSGDIDVIITSSDPKVFKKFVDNLLEQKIILHVLSRGPTKCLVITKINNSVNKARRVDFLYTTPEEFPFAILYFTGSKIFNTVMRQHGLNLGYTFNEHGMYHMTNKVKGKKVDHEFRSEKDIFDFLNLEYRAPADRKDGRAVVIKQKEPTTHIIDNKVVFEIMSDTDEKQEDKKEIVEKKEIEENEKKNKRVKKDVVTTLIFEDESNKDNDIQKNIQNFIKNGLPFLNTLNEKQLNDIIIYSNKMYYNQEPIMTDNQYDIIKEYIQEKYPSNTIINEIGAQVEKNKVKLPYEMASMDKIKPDTDALDNWTKKYKGPYVLSCKLDGVSGLYSTEGKEAKLYTRGNGKVGQDITHLIPHLLLPKTKNVVIRGEFIIPKKVFEEKYKDTFANPRNMVAGIVNHKTISETVKDVHFVAYEVIKPVMKPSEQMDFLQTLNVEKVRSTIENKLSNDLLSETLVDWRTNYEYEIDGVIVTNDAIYDRKSGNPEHAFAFKMVLSDQVAEAKVVDVIWNPSKDGYLKPRVQIEAINLGGVKIEYATGFNAAFIRDNKIGIGSTIQIIRSGDVIPYIKSVTVPASEPKMPTVPYKWNDTHVDIMLKNIEDDPTVREKNITGFFRGIGVEGLSSGIITRLINAGYDTVEDIISMKEEDFLKIEGFKQKLANKIYTGIKNKIDEASIVTLMSASNVFGRGFSEKKIELIMKEIPNILVSDDTDDQKISEIASIKGMAIKSAEAFVDKIDDFKEFLEKCDLENKLYEEPVKKSSLDQSHPLYEKSVVLTGTRDKDILDFLKTVGAKQGSSVSKNTFLVIAKTEDDDTGKADEARKLGIPIISVENFKKKYM
jgi:DNA ligase (NAD+)